MGSGCCKGIQTIRLLQESFEKKVSLVTFYIYSFTVYHEYNLQTAIWVSKLTPCSISVSSRLRLRHLAAASLFLSRLTLLFSSSSGVNCMHNRSDELSHRYRNSFWHLFIVYNNSLQCSVYMNNKARKKKQKNKPARLSYVVLGCRRWSGWPQGAWGLCGWEGWGHWALRVHTGAGVSMGST